MVTKKWLPIKKLVDQLKHTIPTTTNKPVYLPHHTIPVQLQTEVCKCLDTWLKQGIIHPSHSPYVSQVVIVHKKSERYTYVSILELLMPLQSMTLFLYLTLRKPYKQ